MMPEWHYLLCHITGDRFYGFGIPDENDYVVPTATVERLPDGRWL